MLRHAARLLQCRICKAQYTLGPPGRRLSPATQPGGLYEKNHVGNMRLRVLPADKLAAWFRLRSVVTSSTCSDVLVFFYDMEWDDEKCLTLINFYRDFIGTSCIVESKTPKS